MKCIAPEESPMATDWASAIGTVGATIVAILIGAVSVWLTVREHNARKLQEGKAKDLQIRNQAERVAAWLEVEKVEIVEGAISETTCKVVVQNASDQPIWEVGVFHWSLGSAKFSQIPVLPPGGRKTIPSQPKTEGLTIEEAVDIRFRDNAGRSWYRPARVPGMLKLESDSTFESLDTAQPPKLPLWARVWGWLRQTLGIKPKVFYQE